MVRMSIIPYRPDIRYFAYMHTLKGLILSSILFFRETKEKFGIGKRVKWGKIAGFIGEWCHAATTTTFPFTTTSTPPKLER